MLVVDKTADVTMNDKREPVFKPGNNIKIENGVISVVGVLPGFDASDDMKVLTVMDGRPAWFNTKRRD